jgi:hypothetical protein
MLKRQQECQKSSGYDLRQKEKDAALEQFYQENPELRPPPEQGSLFGNGITSIVG